MTRATRPSSNPDPESNPDPDRVFSPFAASDRSADLSRTNTRQTLRLLPGRYTFYGAGATGVPITFDPTGTIDYDPQYTYVSGRGTNTLILSGLLITVDATRLNTQAFGITPATGWLDARRPQTFRLLPGSYHFYVAYVRYFAVTLTTAGTFDYDPTLAGVSGRGTATLTIN